MLQRNLIYTGVTRAKKLVVLVGSRRALAVAVRTKGAGRRHTALDFRLRQTGSLRAPYNPVMPISFASPSKNRCHSRHMSSALARILASSSCPKF